MASEVYKIVNDIAPDYIKDLINIKKSTYNFRREYQTSLPAVKSTRYGLKKVSEYDQEIPQSQTADNPVAPRGRAA